MPDDISRNLPNEICYYIFRLALYGGFTDFWAFWAIRKKLMLSVDWFRFIMGTPEFWTDIMLSPRMSCDAISAYLSRSKNLPLHIHMSFRRADLLLHQAVYFRTANNVVFVREMLHLLDGSSERWLSLRVETDHHYISTFIRHAFYHCRVPALRELSFVYFASRDVANLPSPYPHTPCDWFSGDMRNLETLALRSVEIQWEKILPLHRLKRLSLFTSSPGYHPRFSHYKRLIESSPTLEYVALRAIGCLDLPRPDAFIRSDSVAALDIDFGVDRSLLRVLQRLELPHLVRLGLHINSEDNIAAATSCSSLLSGVLLLRLTGGPSEHTRSAERAY
ncbi:hypothetical protein B0H11DRAFT_1918523 [Mycena galericulata]|nr:hypothetical protein B0H11DRAFT_1918523 [Mycena galericulata]